MTARTTKRYPQNQLLLIVYNKSTKYIQNINAIIDSVVCDLSTHLVI
jgi:hypothetical protein